MSLPMIPAKAPDIMQQRYLPTPAVLQIPYDSIYDHENSLLVPLGFRMVCYAALKKLIWKNPNNSALYIQEDPPLHPLVMVPMFLTPLLSPHIQLLLSCGLVLSEHT